MRSRTRRAGYILAAILALLDPARLIAQTTVPILPRENPDIIFVEAEDALSTNFNAEATLNYSASGKRTLQLSSVADIRGDAGYYADYVFYVPATATYELWYAGTPAGPLEDLYPSFFSPFRYQVDAGEGVAVYREDIVVNENYAPSFYWNRVKPITLEQGVHRLRFEVREKRRYDNRYYFYLDCFFLIRTVDGQARVAEPLPAMFPRDLSSTAIDRPFRSIDDYLVIVDQAAERAQRVSRQIELATVYSMVGDYVNALRYLSRAALLEPDNPTVLLLQAKNQIWKGDLGDGIETYRRLLDLTPQRMDLWVEAGKIAAWTARYDDSVDILTGGLERFPGDLDLMVNLGLTYLWSSRPAEADRMFRASLEAARADLARLKYLADVYRINGYPDYALPVFRTAIAQEPADLESYLLLEDALRDLGRSGEADTVRAQVEQTFVPSADLERYLAAYRTRQGLIQATIREYEEVLARTPDNLELRQLLAQTYFWNGLEGQAVGEYQNVLVNYAYRQLRTLDAETEEIQQAIDAAYLLYAYLGGAPGAVRIAQTELEARGKDLERLYAAYRGAVDSERAARESGAENAAALAQALDQATQALDGGLAAVSEPWARAERLATALRTALDRHETWRGDVARLGEAEAEVMRLFTDEIETSGWTWDRKATLSEASAQASRGLTIAHYVVARIAQIERRYPAAAASWIALQDADPAYTFGRVQTTLWEGKQPAGGYLEALAGLPADVAPYAPSVARMALDLGMTEEGAPSGVGPGAPEDTLAALSDLGTRLAELSRSAETVRRGLPVEIRPVHRLLSDALVRAFYRYEERTVGLRNELGDFYLKAGDRASAIRQYRYVLAIDPTNLDAMFRLGNTLSLAGAWSDALRLYEKVWNVDPLFQNVASLYNRLSQTHGDVAEVSAGYRGEPTRVTWTGSGSYTLPLTSALAFRVSYVLSSILSSATLPTAYNVQAVSLGVPLSLYQVHLTLTPRVGADAVLRPQYLTGDPLSRLGGFLSGHRILPNAGIGVDLDVPNALRVQGDFRAGTYTQTVAQLDTRLALQGSLGISPVLQFLGVPVLRDVYLRTYGELAYLPAAGNTGADLVWLVAQDLVIPIRWSTPLSPSVAIDGALYYTDSTSTTPVSAYHSPQQSMTVKGGLSGSLSLPAGNERLGLSLRASGGYAQDFDLEDQSMHSYGAIEANLGATLSRRTGLVGLRVAFNGSIGTATGKPDLDYWSVSVMLDLTTRMSRYLLSR